MPWLCKILTEFSIAHIPSAAAPPEQMTAVEEIAQVWSFRPMLTAHCRNSRAKRYVGTQQSFPAWCPCRDIQMERMVIQ
jgi:hypothetical protein